MKNTAIFFALVLLAAACGSSEKTESASAAAAPKTEAAADEKMIFIPAEKLASAGIETSLFLEKNIPTTLAVSGEIALHPEHIAQISSISDGILVELRVGLNQKVQRGQIVAVIRKPDLLDLQQQFLETRDRLDFLRSERERLEILKNADATAAKNFQKADADLRAAETSRQVFAAKLRQFQIDPERLGADNLRTEITVAAPVSGVVTAISTSAGAALQAGSPICSVANLSELHGDFWIFEKDLSKVKTGQKLAFLPQNDSKTTVEATIFSIDPTMEPTKKAVRAHARFALGGQQNWTVGLFLEGKIAVGAGEKSRALPNSAFVREGEGEFIFWQKEARDGGQFFEKIAVRTLGSAGDFVAVEPEKALPADAKIVVRGAYYVSAEGSGVELEE